VRGQQQDGDMSDADSQSAGAAGAVSGFRPVPCQCSAGHAEAARQEFLAADPFAPPGNHEDYVPDGRP
jgi:hypothetical protein